MTIRHQKLAKTILNSTSKKEARIKAGYKESYAMSGQIDKTIGFQKESKPLLERYQKELQAIMDAMELKDKNSEEYRILVNAADTIQKQVQLLSGGATERKETIFDDEQIKIIAGRVLDGDKQSKRTPD